MDIFYMLLFIIWCLGGCEIFSRWIQQNGIESYSKLIIVSILCGPIVCIVNSVAILVFLYKDNIENRSYESE